MELTVQDDDLHQVILETLSVKVCQELISLGDLEFWNIFGQKQLSLEMNPVELKTCLGDRFTGS